MGDLYFVLLLFKANDIFRVTRYVLDVSLFCRIKKCWRKQFRNIRIFCNKAEGQGHTVNQKCCSHNTLKTLSRHSLKTHTCSDDYTCKCSDEYAFGVFGADAV